MHKQTDAPRLLPTPSLKEVENNFLSNVVRQVMEAVASASAVLGIAAFGLQIYETLFVFVSKAVNADQYVRSLMVDINLTVSALNRIHKLLQDDERIQKTSRGRRLFSVDGLLEAKSAAEQCMTIFKSILAFILKKGKKGKYAVATEEKHPEYLKIHRAEALSKLESINWALAQDQIELYTARLTTLKLSLVLVFTIVLLEAQHHNL